MFDLTPSEQHAQARCQPLPMSPLRYGMFVGARRWAFYSLGARMCAMDTGYVHGPDLPRLDTPSSTLLPLSYAGPMLQADGESRAYWH